MSEEEYLWNKLEILFPKGNPITALQKKTLKNFFQTRGTEIKFADLRNNSLTEVLIDIINQHYKHFKGDIQEITKFRSERLVRNKYYEMVYAILCNHQYGIMTKKNRLTRLSFRRFAKIFGVNYSTLSENQIIVDFNRSDRYHIYDELHEIYVKIEEIIMSIK